MSNNQSLFQFLSQAVAQEKNPLWGRKLHRCLVTPVSEQIITSAELRKAPSVMVFPAKEMSNSMQEGSREKEMELLRARSELILLITGAGNAPQGLLTAGLE